MKTKLLLFFMFLAVSITAQVSQVERQALIDLYNATDGDNWTNNSNWNTDPNSASDVSTWHGITVTEISAQKYVTHIQLSENNLNGSISSLVDISKLNTLDVSKNALITGPVNLDGYATSLANVQLNETSISSLRLPHSLSLNIKTTPNLFCVEVPTTSLSHYYNLSMSNFDLGVKITDNCSSVLPLSVTERAALKVIYDATNGDSWSYRTYASTEITTGLSSVDVRGFETIDVADERKITKLSFSGMNLNGPLPAEIDDFTELYWLSFENNAISTIDIINNKNLTNLYLNGNDLASLDVTNNTKLTYLSVRNNGINSLDVTKNILLTRLDCNGNNLTSIDVSKNTELLELALYKNQLTSLDVTNNIKLTYLGIFENKLTNLDISNNLELTYLRIHNNLLSALNVVNNTKLESLWLGGSDGDLGGYLETNTISSLDVSNNTKLLRIIAAGLDLSTIDVSQNTDLTLININSNNITSVDISVNDALQVLAFGNNQISTIDVSDKPDLTELYAWKTNLTAVDLTNNPKLEKLIIFDAQLTDLDISRNLLLKEFDINHVKKTGTLDLSNHKQLESFLISNTLLEQINLKNGNNTIITKAEIKDNPNLTCVTVDDVDYATNNFTNVSAGLNFQVNCNTSPDVTTIPDTNFEQALIDLGFDTNGLNGNILNVDAVAIDSLNIQDPLNNTLLPNVSVKIKSLQGIEAMNNLVSLEAGTNELTSIDLSQNTALTNLFLNDNQFTSIDVSANTKLARLGIMRNQVTSVDVSMLTNLQELFVHGNQLASVDITNNTLLWKLYAFDNLLTSIDVTQNTLLEMLRLENNHELQPNNQISSLDLSNNINLKDLRFSNNPINSIDLSNNPDLEFITFYGVGLSSIDVSQNTKLKRIYSGYNDNLSSIDVSNNLDLEWLTIVNNNFTSIGVSNNIKLQYLVMDKNSLSNADVTNNPELYWLSFENNAISTIDISNNNNLTNLYLNGNDLASLDVSNNLLLGEGDPQYQSVFLNENPNLTCIQIDESQNTSNWVKDESGIYSTNCGGENTIVTIPDTNFEQALIDLGFDTNGLNGNILISEAQVITDLDVSEKNISDITGIEAFVNITGLNVRNNNLISVGLSSNTKLTYLSIDENQLTNLDISMLVDLESLYAGDNKLAAIDVSINTSLKKLWVNMNELTSIDISNNVLLEELELDWNFNLSTIDFTNNLSLNRIHLWQTAINTIDVSNLLDLERLYVSETNLTAIDISENTKLYDFRSNGNTAISTYDFSNNKALERIDLSNCDVGSLDLSSNTKLKQLLLSKNKLTGLDISKNTLLEELFLDHNTIVNIDINQNTNLNKLILNDNVLERAYLKNGNNTAILEFDITNNSNLTCVAVDDISFSTNNWTNKDATTNYNIDCASEWEVYTTDENLETALFTFVGLDGDEDGVITYEEAQAFTGDLDLSGQNISSVIGLEAFTNAASINISGNSITDISNLLNRSSVLISSKSTGEKRSIARDNATGIKKLNVANNLIEEIDVSKVTSITELIISNNRLSYLNLNNNSNSILLKVDATGNPNLTCIQVDDVDNANANTNWKKNATASYNTYCPKAALSTQDFLKENISMYPNPATTAIQVIITNNLELKTIEIYNSIGKQVLKTNFDFVAVKNLSSGVYFVRVITDKGFINQKLIKK